MVAIRDPFIKRFAFNLFVEWSIVKPRPLIFTFFAHLLCSLMDATDWSLNVLVILQCTLPTKQCVLQHTMDIQGGSAKVLARLFLFALYVGIRGQLTIIFYMSNSYTHPHRDTKKQRRRYRRNQDQDQARAKIHSCISGVFWKNKYKNTKQKYTYIKSAVTCSETIS